MGETADSSQAAKKRVLAAVHVVVGALLTALASLFGVASAQAVRLVHPDYPGLVTLKAYMPPAPAAFFHGIGIAGLVAVLVAFVTATLLLMRGNRPSAYALMWGSCGAHLLFLLVALSVHFHCVWHLAVILARYG